MTRDINDSYEKLMMIIPNLDFGGAQKSFSNLNKELSKHYTVYVVVFNTVGGIDVPLKGEVIDLCIPAGRNVIMKAIYFFRRVLKIKRLKKKHAIKTSISFLEGADYVNILSKVSDKIILSIRGSKMHDENIKGIVGSLRKKLLIPWLYNKADTIVTVNDSIRKEIINNLGITVNTVTIPNFYDFDHLDFLAKEQPIHKNLKLFKTNAFRIISVGRLAPEKGYQHLIKLISFLKQKHYIKLYLVGDGNYKERLIEVCNENRLDYYIANKGTQVNSSDIYFLGYDENPIKYAKYVDLFVLTSSAEGFPNAMLEMMSQGVPVAGTDCEGIKELLIVDGKNFGTVLPTFDKLKAFETWENALNKMIGNSLLRNELGSLAKSRSTMFNKYLTINQWLSIVGE